MILKTIAINLKQRDWGAAIIEIAIVVIGIFIGLQVDDWNQSRKDRIEEKQVLARLLEETKRAKSIVSEQTQLFENYINNLESLVAFLFSNDAIPNDTTDMQQGFRSSLYYPKLKPARAVYDEISASGRLSLISDDDVRITLSEYYASLESFDSQLSYFRQFANDTESDPFQHLTDEVTYSYDATLPTRRSMSFDFEAMRSNRMLRQTLLISLRHQRNFHTNRLLVLEAVTQACDSIAKTLLTDCEIAK